MPGCPGALYISCSWGVGYLWLLSLLFMDVSTEYVYTWPKRIDQSSYLERSGNKRSSWQWRILTAKYIHGCWVDSKDLQTNEPSWPRAATSRRRTFRRWMMAVNPSSCSIQQLSLRMTRVAVDMEFCWFNYADKKGNTCCPRQVFWVMLKSFLDTTEYLLYTT